VDLCRLSVKVKHLPFVYAIQGLFYASNAATEKDYAKCKDLYCQAIQSFELCLQSDPTNYLSLINSAECSFQLALLSTSNGRNMTSHVLITDTSNEYAISADILYSRALLAQPTSAEAHFLYARFLEQCERYSQAQRRYLTALEIDPNCPRYLSAYASLLRLRGEDNWAAKFEGKRKTIFM
jgi:tetratricopeptide (TPR) repeat protein